MLQLEQKCSINVLLTFLTAQSSVSHYAWHYVLSVRDHTVPDSN